MKSDQMLVADIGGTNARFALATIDNGAIAVNDMQVFQAEDFETIRDAADAYLEAVKRKPQDAAFAVAGPVMDKVIRFTNSPWVFDIEATRTSLSLDKLLVVNDFEALASGVPSLSADDFLQVKPGVGDRNAPVLVIGPGTGLGQALIVPTASGHRIVPTEGGHVSFAPRTDIEVAIMQFIAKEHPRVSVERLLSGRGLVNIHRALCAINDTPRQSLRADEITAAAIEGTYPIAVKAVDMFCAVLGRVAGDAVLATGARGGVVLAGGILPKIKDVLLQSAFAERFLDKGRMRDYVEPVPVNLIIREGAALVGAAQMVNEAGREL